MSVINGYNRNVHKVSCVVNLSFLAVDMDLDSVVAQSLSHIQFFATLWTAALQASASLFFTIPRVCSDSGPLSL